MTHAPDAGLTAELEFLAKTSRILEISGHGDRIFGHLAMRDPSGRGFWMKRSGISLGEVFDHRDFLLIAFDGTILFGEGKRHSEWPIHAELMRKRSDIQLTGHTHPTNCVICSAIEGPLPMLHNRRFRAPPRFEQSSEFILTSEEGAAVAEAMGNELIVLLRHHGVVFCGRSRGEFLYHGIGIEEVCRELLLVSASSLKWTPAPASERSKERRPDFSSTGRDNDFWRYYLRVLERSEQSGDPRLSKAPVR